MDVNGAWVGYGLGDVSATVEDMKKHLVAKFSYAAPLQASLDAGAVEALTYDQTMVDVVTQMQTRYLADPATIVTAVLKVTGVMNFAWQVRCGFAAAPKITILTWQGTGVSMWDTDSPQPFGAAQYVARACPNVFVQPVGNYPAAVYPMGSSAHQGVSEGAKLLTGAEPSPTAASGPVILFGYSQGAVCASWLWRDHILNPSGDCHHRINDVIAAATFGNPLRSPGIANGNLNDASGVYAMPGLRDGQVTGGIAGPDCLRPDEVPDWWYDYVFTGGDGGATELYANAPVGDTPWDGEPDVGLDETLIYNMIMVDNFGGTLEGLVALIKAVVDQFTMPLAELIGLAESIWNGLLFLGNGPAADHYNYDWQPAIEYLTEVCTRWTDTYVNSGGAVVLHAA